MRPQVCIFTSVVFLSCLSDLGVTYSFGSQSNWSDDEVNQACSHLLMIWFPYIYLSVCVIPCQIVVLVWPCCFSHLEFIFVLPFSLWFDSLHVGCPVIHYLHEYRLDCLTDSPCSSSSVIWKCLHPPGLCELFLSGLNNYFITLCVWVLSVYGYDTEAFSGSLRFSALWHYFRKHLSTFPPKFS